MPSEASPPAGPSEAAAPAHPTPSYVLVNPPTRPAAEEVASVERERLAHFLRGCARDTSMAYWEPRIGREQYEAWRDLLLRAGAARWKHLRAEAEPRYRKQGWALTQAPTEILRRLG